MAKELNEDVSGAQELCEDRFADQKPSEEFYVAQESASEKGALLHERSHYH